MIQRDLFQTIRELCESALYLYSIDKVGHAHQLLAKCEAILVENGYGAQFPFAAARPDFLLN